MKSLSVLPSREYLRNELLIEFSLLYSLPSLLTFLLVLYPQVLPICL